LGEAEDAAYIGVVDLFGLDDVVDGGSGVVMKNSGQLLS